MHIDPEDNAVSFAVINPDTNSTIPASDIQDAIAGNIPSGLSSGEIFTVPSATSASEDEVDWPLILGLSIGGALVFVFVIVSVIM